MRCHPVVPVLLLVLPSCESEICGPENGALNTASGTIQNETVVYENWRSSPNNDCGVPGGPVSLTLEASQVETGRGLTLCLPRPDQLSGNSFSIGDSEHVQVIDLFADLPMGCLASLDRTLAGSGTIGFHGVCDDGTSSDGYSLDFQLILPVSILCGADTNPGTFQISGTVSVEATQ